MVVHPIASIIEDSQHLQMRRDYLKEGNKASVQNSCDSLCFSPHVGLNKILTVLHGLLFSGRQEAQLQIDRYLYLTYMVEVNHPCLLQMGTDAFIVPVRSAIHYGNLPNLTSVISRSISTSEWSQNIFSSIFQSVLPYLKRNRNFIHGLGAMKSVDIATTINVLHGLLLGLFPRSTKKPVYKIRVLIAWKLREWMTTPNNQYVIQKYLNLIRLAFLEYLVNVIKDYLPVEFAVIDDYGDFESFCAVCNNVCDIFRQEQLQKDTLDFDALEAAAITAIDKCARSSRFRTKHQNCTVNISYEDLSGLSGDQIAEIFDMKPSQYLGIMSSLHPGFPIKVAQQTHENIQRFPLPPNVAKLQLECMDMEFGSCIDTMWNKTQIHVCIRCVFKNRNNILKHRFRIDAQRSSICCVNCNCSKSIIEVNMIGFVLKILQKSYYICPFCFRIHVWTGTGLEFRKASSTCIEYSNKIRKRSKRQKLECFYCERESVCQPICVFCSALKRNVTIYLCQRHTLPAHLQKFVYDVHSLMSTIRMHEQNKTSRTKMLEMLH